MPVTERSFYKVVVLKIDVFESSIVDERHFPTKRQAEEFVGKLNEADCMGIVVGM